MRRIKTLGYYSYVVCLWSSVSNWLNLTGENINSYKLSFLYMPIPVGLDSKVIFVRLYEI